ncbi:hypothetical protein ACQKGC_05645 [Allorhizobium pseudoryzae]|uniref:hypothetical protein n=1 Tax=Allorhizobium pseudoryzae TaxID=379684 RepID=UPI003CFCA812
MKHIAGNLLFVLTFCILASSCQTQSSFPDAPKPHPGKRYNLDAVDALVVQNGLRGSVRDPLSLIFGKASAIKRPDGTIEVCGMVNGKNGFGGYTGFVPYNGLIVRNTAGDQVFAVTGIGDGGNRDLAIAMLCERNGVI